VERTLGKYRMLEKDDRILLAVSGGKDSLSLWRILTNLGYEADGLYVDLGIGDSDYSKVSREKCIEMQEKIGRKLHIIDLKSEIGGTIDEIRRIFPKTCSACGTVKRYFMNKITLEGDYNVVATGHNLDDEVSTLFGNLIQWDERYLERQFPVIPEKDGFAKKIKPLVRNSEKQVAIYALVSGIDYIRTECPYSSGATSVVYKENLNRLEEQAPGILRFFLHNFFRSRKRKQTGDESEPELRDCIRCGQRTISDLCRYCRIQEKLQRKFLEAK
jgi:uncharacterized protein (TIGR00269 family)